MGLVSSDEIDSSDVSMLLHDSSFQLASNADVDLPPPVVDPIFFVYEIPPCGRYLTPTRAQPPDGWISILRRHPRIRCLTRILKSQDLAEFAGFLESDFGKCMLYYSVFSQLTLFEACLFRVPNFFQNGYQKTIDEARDRERRKARNAGARRMVSYEGYSSSFCSGLKKDCYSSEPGFWESALRLIISSAYFNPNLIVNSLGWFIRSDVASAWGVRAPDFSPRVKEFNTVTGLLARFLDRMRVSCNRVAVETKKLMVWSEYREIFLNTLSHPNLNWDQQYSLKRDESTSSTPLLWKIFRNDHSMFESWERHRRFLIPFLEKFGDAFGMTSLESMSKQSRRFRIAVQRLFGEPRFYRQFFLSYRTRWFCQKWKTTVLLCLSCRIPLDVIRFVIFPYFELRQGNDMALRVHVFELRNTDYGVYRHKLLTRPEHLVSELSAQEYAEWVEQILHTRPSRLREFGGNFSAHPGIRARESESAGVVRDYFDPEFACYSTGESVRVLGEMGETSKWLVVQKNDPSESEEGEEGIIPECCVRVKKGISGTGAQVYSGSHL